MTQFTFYTLDLGPVPGDRQQLLPLDETGAPLESDPIDWLLAGRGSLMLVTPRGWSGGDPDEFRCQVIRYADGVALLTLEDNKTRHTTVDLRDQAHEHHPFCHIVLDNRQEGRRRVGIGRTSAFGSDPGLAAHVLGEGLSGILRDRHLKVGLQLLAKENRDLWDVVDEVVTHHHDHVTQIRLDFDPRQGQEADGSLLDTLMRVADKAGGDMLLALTNGKAGGLRVEDLTLRRDLQRIAEECLRSRQYSLAVRFRKFGLYRYGASMPAQFGMPDDIVRDFSCGQTAMGYGQDAPSSGLAEWLDTLNIILDKDYHDIPLQPQRARSRRA